MIEFDDKGADVTCKNFLPTSSISNNFVATEKFGAAVTAIDSEGSARKPPQKDFVNEIMEEETALVTTFERDLDSAETSYHDIMTGAPNPTSLNKLLLLFAVDVDVDVDVDDGIYMHSHKESDCW